MNKYFAVFFANDNSAKPYCFFLDELEAKEWAKAQDKGEFKVVPASLAYKLME